jgi:hypothetical protein
VPISGILRRAHAIQPRGPDLFAERTIATRAAWLGALAAESACARTELGSAERTPVDLDAETRAAITV